MNIKRPYITFRNFLFSKTNREFLIFLFFLALSSIFWLLKTLDQTYETEVKVPIMIMSVPKDVMLTSDEVDTVRVTVRDKGLTIAGYRYGDAIKPIKMAFKNYDQGNGTGIISSTDLQRAVLSKLTGTSAVVSIKPERLKFYYNNGSSKRVPIKWSGRVIPEHLYFISHVSYSTDSVTVYASPEKLDSIKVIYTEPLNYSGFRDTLTVDCRLRKAEGIKVLPDHVSVSFQTDVLTEESIDGIPVRGINMPVGKVLRTFPARVKVNFVTGINVYRSLKASDFVVVADYNELIDHPAEKCKIYLRKTPEGISRVSLAIEQVDYLIEEANQESH